MADETQAGRERAEMQAQVERLEAEIARLKADCEQCGLALSEEAQKRYLLMALMDHVADAIYFKDDRSRFMMISRSTCRRFGLKSPDEAIGKTDFDMFTGEHANQAFRDEQEIIRTGKPVIGKEERETWPDGSETWVSTSKMPLYGDNGRILGTFGISRDITARKRMEAELRDSEERYRNLIQLAPDVIYRLDAQGILRFVSDAVRQLGYSPEDVTGTAMADLVHADDREEFDRCMARMAEGEGPPSELEVRLCTRKGGGDKPLAGYVHMLVTTRSIWEADEATGLRRLAGFEGMMHDISMRKRAEEELRRHREHLEELVAERTKELVEANARLQQEIGERQRAQGALMQAERMEAIRSVANGVASNFNSILDSISGYASSIADNFLPGNSAHENAMRILEGTRRAGELTQRLMGVAGSVGRKGRTEPVHLGTLVTDATGFVQEIFRRQHIAIRVRNPVGMPWVDVDRSRFVDTVMTFMLNAAEAMPEGGEIRIEAEDRLTSAPTQAGRAAKKAPYAVLSIRDTGHGILAEDLKHIFEPFFTTKKSRTAFGLGLSFAQMVIQSMGGWITVRSTVGKGTTFRIFLPKARPSTAARKAGARPAQESREGRMVLVLDRREESIQMMEEAIQQVGFKVLTVTNPTRGVEMLNRHGDKIIASIVDAMLADAGGESFVKTIRDLQPRIRVLVTSGFSREYVRSILPPGAWTFIQRPFDGAQLVKALGDALDGPERPS